MRRESGDWRARIQLHPTVFIAPGAVVVGDVTLGEGASVWFNAVVRGDTAPITVGAGSNLQDLSVVHVDEGKPARIGARVTVGHRVVIHGCEIGDECLIGMGSVVLSGARVGEGSLIGAAALVLENQVIPPGSVALGAPARVRGEVSPGRRDSLRESAGHYRALARSYLERGFARPHPLPAAATGRTPHECRPVGPVEWTRLLAVLAESPHWVEQRLGRHHEVRWGQPPAAGRPSALEILCRMRDAEREILLPRLERMLVETHPLITEMGVAEGEARYDRAESPRAVYQAWREWRRALLARLAPLEPADWARVGYHAVRGPWPLGEMVREWAEQDLLDRRRLAESLGEFA